MWTLYAFCILGFFCLVAFAFLPRDLTHADANGNITEVIIPTSAIYELLDWMLLAGFLLPLTAGIILVSRRRILLGLLLVIAITPVSLVAWGIGLVRNLAPWIPYDSVVAPDASEYYFVDSNSHRGQIMAIARVKSRNPLYLTMDVLGTTNGDSPRSYLLVIRPTALRTAPYGALYATPSGLIVGLRFDNQCYLVYDIAAQKFYGHGDVERLSPFLLLDERSSPFADDEDRILSEIRVGGMGVPTRDSQERAQTHPNAAVRASANRILTAMHP